MESTGNVSFFLNKRGFKFPVAVYFSNPVFYDPYLFNRRLPIIIYSASMALRDWGYLSAFKKSTMLRRFLSILVISLSFMRVCAQSEISSSRWMTNNISVDGNDGEWKKPLNFYDSQNHILFGIANDSDCLYFCFESTDRMSQVKMGSQGMKITINTHGKNKHSASIQFPLEESADTAEGSTSSVQKKNYLEQHHTMNVEGFATRKGIIPSTDSSGLQAAMRYDSTEKLTYEVSVPFKELFGTDFSIDDLSKEISLLAEIKPMEHRQSSPQNGYGHGGRGRGMHSGGGKWQGGNRNAAVQPGSLGDAGHNMLFEKTSIRQKFTLSQSPG